MVTEEYRINLKRVKITWEFEDIMDKLDDDWAEWALTGTDEEGNEYQGTAQATISDPEDCYEEIEIV